MSAASQTPELLKTLPVFEQHVTIIEPSSAWRPVNWAELYAYRDLFRFLTWRSIKVRYAQSAVGIGWAIIQPLCQMVIFTIMFGRLAGIDSDGSHYAVFSLVALVPWTYFANALTESADSLVSNAQMLSKVYFPRLVLPLSAVVAKLFDFAIALVMVAIVLAIFKVRPTWGILMLPYLVGLMMLSALGLGLWLSALAIHYRDVKHALGFISQLLMYASPVIFSATIVPAKWQKIYALNPMVGVIEGFRAALLGTRPMPWDWIAIGSLTAILLLLTGLLYFRHQERLFADVV